MAMAVVVRASFSPTSLALSGRAAPLTTRQLIPRKLCLTPILLTAILQVGRAATRHKATECCAIATWERLTSSSSMVTSKPCDVELRSSKTGDMTFQVTEWLEVDFPVMNNFSSILRLHWCLMYAALLAIVLSGCGKTQSGTIGASPQEQATAQQTQIERIKNDPKMPADQKELAIKEIQAGPPRSAKP